MAKIKIGIDLDDTICNTTDSINYYADIYCSKLNIDTNLLFTDTNYKKDFLNNNLENIYRNATIKKDAKEIISTLKEKGYELYIITARTNNYINTNMEKLIKNYLNENGIYIDKIIINTSNKVDTCLKNNINYIIDDSLYNCELLDNNGINTILFDDKNSNLNYKNRVSNWKEILKIFN